MSKLDRRLLRVGNPIFWGIIATIAIILSSIILLNQITCAKMVGGFNICQSKLSYLASAPPNEIGDTIAGISGALAFLWIIVTVWIQSIELQLQRSELELTRAEMKTQREASEEMARAQVAQVAVLQTQASILEDERKHREIAATDAAIETTLDRVIYYARMEGFVGPSIEKKSGNGWSIINVLNLENTKVTSFKERLPYGAGERVRELDIMSYSMHTFLSEARSCQSNFRLRFESDYGPLKDFHDALEEVVELTQSASSRMRSVLRVLGIKYMRDLSAEILALNFENRSDETIDDGHERL